MQGINSIAQKSQYNQQGITKGISQNTREDFEFTIKKKLNLEKKSKLMYTGFHWLLSNVYLNRNITLCIKS